MDQLPPESQESLRKTGTERLRVRLVRAGLDEVRVMEMDRPELLEAAAKEMAKETPTELRGDTQEVPPPNRAGSVESDTDSAAFRALELEIEEKRWLREERKAEREAQEKRAEREARRRELKKRPRRRELSERPRRRELSGRPRRRELNESERPRRKEQNEN